MRGTSWRLAVLLAVLLVSGVLSQGERKTPAEAVTCLWLTLSLVLADESSQCSSATEVCALV